VAVVTDINLTAGGSTDEIVVEDQNGNPLPPSNISWAPFSDPNVTVAPSSDGSGFVFSAAAAAIAESLQTTATYSGPGNPGSVQGPVLTVNVASAPPPLPTVTALQYDETQGS
jgi:hypothetical protein